MKTLLGFFLEFLEKKVVSQMMNFTPSSRTQIFVVCSKESPSPTNFPAGRFHKALGSPIRQLLKKRKASPIIT